MPPLSRIVLLLSCLTLLGCSRDSSLFLNSEIAEMRSQLDSMSEELEIPIVEQTSGRIGYHSNYSSKPEQKQWLQLDMGQIITPDAIILVPAFVNYGNDPQPDYGFPQRFRIEISDDANFGTSRIIADESQADYQLKHHPFYHATGDGLSGRYIRITATQLGIAATSPDAQRRYALVLGEIMVIEDNLNQAISAQMSAPSQTNVPPAWHIDNAIDGQTYLGLPQWKGSSPQNGFHSHIFTDSPNQDEWVEVDLGSEMPLSEIRLIPARPIDYPESSGFGFPIDFKVQIGRDRQSFEDVFATVDFPNPGAQVVTLPLPPESIARYIKVTASRLRERSGDYIFALAELQAFSGNENIALGKSVTSSTVAEGASSWSPEALVDGFSSRGKLLDWPLWIEELRLIAESRDLAEELEYQLELLVKQQRKKIIIIVLGMMSAAIFLLTLLLIRNHTRRLRENEALRQRFARDLHDEIGSNLSHIRILAELAEGQSNSPDTIGQIEQVAEETLESMRDMIWLTQAEPKHWSELFARMREIGRRLIIEENIELSLPSSSDSHSRQANPLPLDFARNFLLFYKESLNNIAKHAPASQVKIQLIMKQSSFSLTIEDDGPGFDPEHLHDSKGCGLLNLQTRAGEIKGKLNIKSSPGQGTRLQLEAPLPS